MAGDAHDARGVDTAHADQQRPGLLVDDGGQPDLWTDEEDDECKKKHYQLDYSLLKACGRGGTESRTGCQWAAILG